MVPFGGCACLLILSVVCLNDTSSVQNIFFLIVRFACMIEPAASSFSAVRGTGTKCLCSVCSVQLTNLGALVTKVPESKHALK